MNLPDYKLTFRKKNITIPIYLIISFLTVFAIGPQYFLNLSFILNQTIIQNGFTVGTYDILLPSVISNLAFAFGVPIGPTLSRKYGLRRSYLTLILIFFAGSLLNTFSAHLSLLIVGRALQGLSAGLLFLIILPVSLIKFPNHIRNRFLLLAIGGLFGSSAFGAFFGSLSLSADAWRWLFALSGVASIACFVIAFAVFPKDLDNNGQAHAQPVDKRGILLHGITVVCLAILLSNLQKMGLNSMLVWPFILLACFFFLLFLIHELRYEYPMVPMRTLFVAKPLCGSIMAFASHLALICSIIGINGMLRNIDDVPFKSLTYFYICFVLGIIVFAFLSSWLYDLLGAGLLGLIGSLAVTLISLRWEFIDGEASLPSLYLQMGCLGGAVGTVLVSGALGTALAGDIHKASMRSVSLHYFRNLLGGIAAPVIGWYLAQDYTIHYETLRDQIGSLNPEVTIEMDTMTQSLAGSGLSAANAKASALFSLLGNASKSSLLGAYHDLFRILLLLSAIMVVASIGMALTGKGRVLVQKQLPKSNG